MPIAPIVGRFRKKLLVDLSVALGLGVSAGFAYWHGYHLKHVQRHEEFYLNLEKQRQQGMDV